MKDYYLILELTPSATSAEIKAAYRDKIRFYHPDRWRDDPTMHPRAEERTKEINKAYQVLSDPVSRADYDRRQTYAPPPRQRPSRPQAWAQPEPYETYSADATRQPASQRARVRHRKRSRSSPSFGFGTRGLIGIILLVAGTLALIGLLAGRTVKSVTADQPALPAAPTGIPTPTPPSLPTLPGLSLARVLPPDTWCAQPSLCQNVREAYGIAWSPPGERLAIVNDNRTVALWNNSTQAVERVLADPCPEQGLTLGPWRTLAWSPDGHRLAAGSDDHTTGNTAATLAIWDADTWAVRHCISAGDVASLTWSPDSRLITRSGIFNTTQIQTWDDADGLSTFSLPGSGHGWFVRWSPGGRFLAYDDGNLVTFRDVSTGDNLQPFDQPWAVSETDGPTALEWSPDAREIAVKAGAGMLYVVSKTPGGVLFQRDFTNISQIAWAPDSKRLAVAGGPGLALIDLRDGTVREQVFTQPGASQGQNMTDYAAWSPDGQVLAVLAHQGGQDSIWIWEVRSP